MGVGIWDACDGGGTGGTAGAGIQGDTGAFTAVWRQLCLRETGKPQAVGSIYTVAFAFRHRQFGGFL